jgi:hypothetical protein
MHADVDRLLRQLRKLAPAAAPISSPTPATGSPLDAGPGPRPGPAPGPVPGRMRGPMPGPMPGATPGPRTGTRPRTRPAGSATPRATPLTLPSPWGVRARVVLAAFLAAAVTQWPYIYCGINLAAYLAATGMVVIAGAWAAHAAWRRRMGWAHVVALSLILTGATLAALQVLPRPGHAPAPIAWRCNP